MILVFCEWRLFAHFYLFSDWLLYLGHYLLKQALVIVFGGHLRPLERHPGLTADWLWASDQAFVSHCITALTVGSGRALLLSSYVHKKREMGRKNSWRKAQRKMSQIWWKNMSLQMQDARQTSSRINSEVPHCDIIIKPSEDKERILKAAREK